MFSLIGIPTIGYCYLITLALLILQFVYSGNAIKCFVCDSTRNPSCTDLKDSSLVAEECSLEKTISVDSWLFKLNELSYHPMNYEPLFTCQKVVARIPRDNRVVTARFCQLHTAESDACQILEKKMLERDPERQENNYNRADFSSGRYNNYENHNNRNNDDGVNTKDCLLHCSICTEDRCNGNANMSVSKWCLLLPLTLIYLLKINFY